MSKKVIFFIADAHLGSLFKKEDLREKKLISFCDFIKDTADRLYLLGDIFDFWFEYKTVVPADYFPVLSAFHNLVKSNTEVIYVGGNHDFWTGSYLTDSVGIRVHFSPVTETLQGKKIHICHGDGFLRKDPGYLIIQWILKNRVNRFLYKLIHPGIGIPFAKFVSSRSRRYVDKRLDIDKVVKDYRMKAGEFLGHSEVDALIMGHTHKADLQEFNGKTYINAGNWLSAFDYVKLEDGEFSLGRFDD
jgi:UDP-2,3-diacylglucosamine hydrolase